MGDHSYGHGQFCHYCGVDGDEDDDKLCDESINKKATHEERAEWAKREKEARVLTGLAFDYEIGVVESPADVVARVQEWAAQCMSADSNDKKGKET